MKLTLLAEHTEGVKEFFEMLKVEGYVGSIKAIRLDEIHIGSEPSYAIRLKGNFRDCLWLFKRHFKGFHSDIMIGWWFKD